MEPNQSQAYIVFRTFLLNIQTIVFGIALIIGILLFRPDIVDRANRIKNVNLKELHSEYDFIIVGGGTAGCVVANRLSENPNWTVLLLEAGGRESLIADIPFLAPKLQMTSADWQYQSEPSDQFCLDQHNRANLPQGKVIGGSSTINAMLYVRGNKKDYDRWEELGNTGWNYSEALKYFKKSENIQIPNLKNSPYHGTEGYLTVEEFRYKPLITDGFAQAYEELGFPQIDINGASQNGYSRSQGTLKEGLRCSTAKCYLRPVQSRTNLHISLDSYVMKILFNSSKAAIGVEFQKGRRTFVVRSKKEVILSAGSIKTPQILMLSGIGPPENLQQMGIPLILPKPGVGQNLQDHVALGGITFLFTSPPSSEPVGAGIVVPRIFTPKTLYEFLFQHNGPLYDLPSSEIMGFASSKYNDDATWPDLQLVMASSGDNDDAGLVNRKDVGLTWTAYRKVFDPILFKDAFTVVPLLLKPRSIGYIQLRDTNPKSKPRIFLNFYQNPLDMKIMIEGAKLSYALGTTKALRKYNATFHTIPLPGCENYTLLSDGYWECEARHYTLTLHHPVGTAKMGPINDTEAVVSPELLVHGISNLRIIDASIMPKIVCGNTNAPTIMIAEKGSDMVKKKWSSM